jgi:hypothetical protein
MKLTGCKPFHSIYVLNKLLKTRIFDRILQTIYKQ